jgi:glucose/arabinose dehydrogenase
MTKKVAQDIRFGCFLVTAVLVALLLSYESYGEELPLKNIRLPTGFEISVYATLPNARSMTLSPKGTLFVGSLKEGKIYAVPAQTGGAAPKKAATVAQGLNMPNGVAFRDGALYVAEVNRVLRYDDIESRLSNPLNRRLSTTAFPKSGTTVGNSSPSVRTACFMCRLVLLVTYASPMRAVTR